jgi:Coenzyme PQQ synthesis protein D (PqqD)
MSQGDNARAESFAERYALEVIDETGEGVLVDLETGSFFHLNASAALVCQLLSERTATDVVERLAERLKISSSAAAALVASVSDGLARPPGAPAPLDMFVYRAEGGGHYALDQGDRRVFTIDSGAGTFRAYGSFRDEPTLAEYVRALVPKLLVLLGKPILHAAACRIGSRTIAVCGRSGAGKTTTARAFERAGAGLLSEDLLILSSGDDRPTVYVEGERAAREWCRAAARNFTRAPGSALAYESLRDVGSGATIPLDALWFVDSERRVGDELVLEAVSKARAATLLLGNGFLATSDAPTWRRFLVRAAHIARRVPVYEATTPAGLDPLAAAVRAYAENSAS